MLGRDIGMLGCSSNERICCNETPGCDDPMRYQSDLDCRYNCVTRDSEVN